MCGAHATTSKKYVGEETGQQGVFISEKGERRWKGGREERRHGKLRKLAQKEGLEKREQRPVGAWRNGGNEGEKKESAGLPSRWV